MTRPLFSLRLTVALAGALLTAFSATAHAAPAGITDLCPVTGVQPSRPRFEPGGIIITAFDNRSLWALNLTRQTRYPLPDTRPCTTNCHLSPDATWITVYNPVEQTIDRMRLDGSQRRAIAERITEAQWWDDEHFLVWSNLHLPALQTGDDAETRSALTRLRLISLQPGGQWGVVISANGDGFSRALVNLTTPQSRVPVGLDVPYFNAAAWSPDGVWFAYVSPVETDGVPGGEIFAINPAQGFGIPTQWTRLSQQYGAVRIGGHIWGDGLSWSPDGTRIAFWVTPSTGYEIDPDAPNPDPAVIHVLDVATGALTRYCGYSTDRHTPNPPRLVWSPDSTHLAFAGRVESGLRGTLMIALDTESGTFTELSSGVHPVLGQPNAIAWGRLP